MHIILYCSTTALLYCTCTNFPSFKCATKRNDVTFRQIACKATLQINTLSEHLLPRNAKQVPYPHAKNMRSWKLLSWADIFGTNASRRLTAILNTIFWMTASNRGLYGLVSIINTVLSVYRRMQAGPHENHLWLLHSEGQGEKNNVSRKGCHWRFGGAARTWHDVTSYVASQLFIRTGLFWEWHHAAWMQKLPPPILWHFFSFIFSCPAFLEPACLPTSNAVEHKHVLFVLKHNLRATFENKNITLLLQPFSLINSEALPAVQCSLD